MTHSVLNLLLNTQLHKYYTAMKYYMTLVLMKIKIMIV